jgi:hypothetical protein
MPGDGAVRRVAGVRLQLGFVITGRCTGSGCAVTAVGETTVRPVDADEVPIRYPTPEVYFHTPVPPLLNQGRRIRDYGDVIDP